MAERPIEQLTLREMVIDAERLARELIEHLELGFIPKVQALERLVRPSGGAPYDEHVEDVTVRNQSARLLDSEVFTDELYERVQAYCRAIDGAVERVLTEG